MVKVITLLTPALPGKVTAVLAVLTVKPVKVIAVGILVTLIAPPVLKTTASLLVGPAALVLGVQFAGTTHEPDAPPAQVYVTGLRVVKV